MNPTQLCNLRGHFEPVTSATTFSWHNSTTLVTADGGGWVIWWCLDSKRPLGVWKAHDDTIVSVQQVGDGLVLTHSRDSDIKVWDIGGFRQFCRLVPQRILTLLGTLLGTLLRTLPKTLLGTLAGAPVGAPATVQPAQHYPVPECAVIPVNALTFCNVDHRNGLLITPSTVDSDNFDIYRLFGPSKQDTPPTTLLTKRLNLKRLAANVSGWKLWRKAAATNCDDIEGEIELEAATMAKRDKFGIVMRVLWVSDSVFYVGYESGHLLGFSIDVDDTVKVVLLTLAGFDKMVVNKDAKITVVSYNESLSPNPVLSLVADPTTQKLFVGSTGKKLLVLDLVRDAHCSTYQYEGQLHNLRHPGISSIAVDRENLVVGFWDGVMKGYNFDMEETFKIKRNLPRINLVESTSGQQQDQEPELENMSVVKLNVLQFLKHRDTSKDSTSQDSKSQNLGYKALVKARNSVKGAHEVVAACYNDGCITLYQL